MTERIQELSFAEAGDGPPVVILHGLFGNKRNWGAIAKPLSTEFRVLAVDLRNHGDSPWADTMSYPEMARDVAALIRDKVGEPAAVIGHSMGGKAAMLMAFQDPDLVERLMVVDIPPAPRDSGLSSYVTAMRSMDLTQVKRRADAEALLTGAVGQASIRAFLVQNLAMQDGAFAWKLNLEAIDNGMPDIEGFPDIDSDLAYEGPCLHLVGAKSSYVLPHHHAEIDRLFPNAEVDAIPDADHWVHADQPKAFLDRVRVFLGG